MSVSNIAKMTELDALNSMLASIGSAPLVSLTNPQNADALTAQNILTDTLKETQSEKWYFNTEENYPLSPDEDGIIAIPANLLSVDVIGRFGDYRDVIVRGNKLYDRGNHTYTFTETIYVNVHWCLVFDDLPETAKQYVITRATRKFQEIMLGDPSLYKHTQIEETTARAKLIDEDLMQRKVCLGVVAKPDPTVGFDFREL